jgi:DNA-binding protein YbaB
MMKGGIAGLMKQAQQMQENMKKAQEQLAQLEVEGQSGAGMVKVLMTCKPRCAPCDHRSVGDGRQGNARRPGCGRAQRCMRRAEEVSQERMAGFTAGLNLPPGMKLPF